MALKQFKVNIMMLRSSVSNSIKGNNWNIHNHWPVKWNKLAYTFVMVNYVKKMAAQSLVSMASMNCLSICCFCCKKKRKKKDAFSMKRLFMNSVTEYVAFNNSNVCLCFPYIFNCIPAVTLFNFYKDWIDCLCSSLMYCMLAITHLNFYKDWIK